MDIYGYCGFTGGILIPLSLIPQIYKSYITKDLRNISYYWQFTYIVALILILIYSINNKLEPIYIPSSLELIFILILTFMKYYYSNCKKIDINIDQP